MREYKLVFTGPMGVGKTTAIAAISETAPMEIIQERTIGPTQGAENIKKGFDSVMYGFAAIMVFMCIYYALFGLFSSIALAVNLMLLVAILSILQATLTLPRHTWYTLPPRLCTLPPNSSVSGYCASRS